MCSCRATSRRAESERFHHAQDPPKQGLHLLPAHAHRPDRPALLQPALNGQRRACSSRPARPRMEWRSRAARPVAQHRLRARRQAVRAAIARSAAQRRAAPDMVSAHRTEVCVTPHPVMSAKLSAKHCDSIRRDRASIPAVLPWNRVKANRFSRGLCPADAGRGQSVPTVPTEKKRPIVSPLESLRFQRFRDVGTLGTRFASHDVCARTHEGRRAGERARLHVHARAAVPTVPTSHLLKYIKYINKLTMGHFSSFGTVGTLALDPVRPSQSRANKILPEIQRDGAAG